MSFLPFGLKAVDSVWFAALLWQRRGKRLSLPFRRYGEPTFVGQLGSCPLATWGAGETHGGLHIWDPRLVE